MKTTTHNVNPAEVKHFGTLAARWWDPEGEFKPLHDINPLRLEYIHRFCKGLAGKKVLDVGCGGGILSESMAREGARVTGMDMSEPALEVARLHLYESGLEIAYELTTVEELAARQPGAYDVVTCMEMLEHVPDPVSVVRACGQLLGPGGQAFFSTLNRNPKSYLFAIIGAEYLLRLLPKGTHDYTQFIQPSELAAWLRQAEFRLEDLTGLSYNPLTREYRLGRNLDVNYLAYARREE